MAAKKTTLNELGDMLTHVVKHMATKDDIARLDTRIDKLDAKIDSVESNLAGKLNRLDTKLTKFEEHEIDKRLQLDVRVSGLTRAAIMRLRAWRHREGHALLPELSPAKARSQKLAKNISCIHLPGRRRHRCRSKITAMRLWVFTTLPKISTDQPS